MIDSDRDYIRFCLVKSKTDLVRKISQRDRLEICLVRLFLSSKFKFRTIRDP